MSGLGATNRNVQNLKKLLSQRSQRHTDGQFVIEGPVLASEAVRAGWTCLAQYVPAGSGDEVAGAGVVHELAPGVLDRIASTQTPQAPLTLARMRTYDTAVVLDAASFVVVLDQVNDPGNLGTIIRSAEAAGADAVVLTPGSVDAYNPKVLRSSAGAIFHLPVLVATLDDVAAAGFELAGTSSHDFAGRTVFEHTTADLTGRLAIVMGNEAAGLPADWDDQNGPIGTWLTIRHRGRSESLNVAMAATVLVFEAARQRTDRYPLGSDPS